MDREGFARWQADALRRHLDWAATTIPFHRERVTPGTALGDFPILGRRDVQAHREALRDPARAPEALRESASGGSK